MKRLATLLLAAALAAAPAAAQTIKSLGYNATNGNVVYSGTNALTFTNAVRAAAFQGANSNSDSFLISEALTGFFEFKTQNTNDGNMGLYIYNDDDSLFGAVLLGVRLGDAFIQSQTTNVRAETIGGVLANLAADTISVADAATTRTNLGLSLPALTNTSNVTMMRALAGSTDTNHPFSGSISVVGTNNTNTLVFSNGILLEAP
jgi:hypothetical protein